MIATLLLTEKKVGHNLIYCYDYPKLLNKFIKLKQISNYAITLKSELSSGTKSPELFLSGNVMLKWLS